MGNPTRFVRSNQEVLENLKKQGVNIYKKVSLGDKIFNYIVLFLLLAMPISFVLFFIYNKT